MTACLVLLGICLADAPALGQVRARPPQGLRQAPLGMDAQAINLPYTVNDDAGDQWMVYQNGWFQQQGGQPGYSQSAMLSVNSAQPQMRTNMARLEGDTGELVIERMSAGALVITRRILLNVDRGFIRYLDVIENPTDRDQTATVQIASQIMLQMTLNTPLTDPADKAKQLGWIGQSDIGRAAFELSAGRGAMVIPRIQWQEPSRRILIDAQLSIPARKQVALLHVHGIAESAEAAREVVTSLTQRQLLSTVPRDLQPLVVNFTRRQALAGDQEILRGEMFDVIELHGGDQIQGTLKAQTYLVHSFAGPVELPAERVIGMVNTGGIRPRTLVVTVDGQVIGGELGTPGIAIVLATGQSTEVPIASIARVGFRRRSDEPEVWALTEPHVVLRSGDRIAIEPLVDPVDLMTRYGLLRLEASSLAAIVLQSEEHGVHEVDLSDGTRLLGLLAADRLPIRPKLGLEAPPAGVAISGLERVQFAPEMPEPDAAAPSLETLSGDRLIGALSGEMELVTAFDTLAIKAPELRGLRLVEGLSSQVELVLYDGSTLRGELRDGGLSCVLRSGLTINLPASMVREYRQPEPAAPQAVAEQIRAVVSQLNADDWQIREAAEQKLVAMGEVVAPVLRQLRESQPPEARQRIDQVLAQFQHRETPKPLPGPARGSAPPFPDN
jgi:hypothetical protein